MTRGLGTLAYGILLIVLAWVAWRLLRGDRPRDGVLLALLAGLVVWERLTPLLVRREPTPRSRFVGGAVAAVVWLGLALFLAFPELVFSPRGDVHSLLWVRVLIMTIVGSPAGAFLHLALRSDLPVATRDHWHLRLARLGPLAVGGYLLGLRGT